MKEVKKIVLQGAYTDLNTYSTAERGNKFRAASIKKDETERVWAECMYNKVTSVEEYPVHIHFHWYCKNPRKDPDNISFAKKYILDGLQYAGIMVNDGWKQISGFQDSFYIDADNPRVEVVFSVIE